MSQREGLRRGCHVFPVGLPLLPLAFSLGSSFRASDDRGYGRGWWITGELLHVLIEQGSIPNSDFSEFPADHSVAERSVWGGLAKVGGPRTNVAYDPGGLQRRRFCEDGVGPLCGEAKAIVIVGAVSVEVDDERFCGDHEGG